MLSFDTLYKSYINPLQKNYLKSMSCSESLTLPLNSANNFDKYLLSVLFLNTSLVINRYIVFPELYPLSCVIRNDHVTDPCCGTWLIDWIITILLAIFLLVNLLEGQQSVLSCFYDANLREFNLKLCSQPLNTLYLNYIQKITGG